MKKIIRVLFVLVLMPSLSLYSQNAPSTIAPQVFADAGTNIAVPVMVSGFSNIGAVSLTLKYDSTVLIYLSATVNATFPELSIENPTPGSVIIGGFTSSGGAGVSLPDSSVLFTLSFTFMGGSSGLIWYDNGSSCEFTGPPPMYSYLNDSPQASYYTNGSVNVFPLPATAGPVTGPAGGNVCKGQSGVVFSVSPITNATDYMWSLPEGASVISGAYTNEITVAFSSTAGNGNVAVYGTNAYGTGAVSPLFPLTLNSPPSVLVQPLSPDPVNAGSGVAVFIVLADGYDLTYQWQEFTSAWADITDGGVYAGTASSALSITDPLLSMNGYRYRCTIDGMCEPQVSTDGNAMLTVNMVLGSFDQPLAENSKRNFSVFPNPCNEHTTFRYSQSENAAVVIEIRNAIGILVKTISCNYAKEGLHEMKIETDHLQPGLYYAILQVQDKINSSMSTLKLVKK
jgi:hypothetical protein